MHRLHVAILLAFAALIETGWAQAVLVSWDVNGLNAASTSEVAGSRASAIDSANLHLGSGITASSAASTFGGANFNQPSFANAVADNDYIAITISAADGYNLSLSSVSYLVGKASNSTTLSAVLTSSVTGHTTDGILDTYTFSNASPSLRSITLSNVASLQNINGTVEFHLYGVSSSTDTFRLRSNTGADLSINGTLTAVPEPATNAAIAGAVAFIAVWLHRRRTGSPELNPKKPAETRA